MLSGIETFLSFPIFPDRISQEAVMQLWQLARIIDSICTRYLMGVNPKEEIKQHDIKSLNRCIEKAKVYAQQIINIIDQLISELKPL